MSNLTNNNSTSNVNLNQNNQDEASSGNRARQRWADTTLEIRPKWNQISRPKNTEEEKIIIFFPSFAH